jgi:hypothetical protein
MPTNINMSELATGDDIDAIAASKLTGALPAINGASLTNLPASGVSVIAGAFGSTSSFSFTPTNAYFYVWGCGGGGGSILNGSAGAGGGAAAQAQMGKVACTANTSVSVAIGSGSSGNGGATTFTQGSVIASLGGGAETTYYTSPGAGGTHSGITGYVRNGMSGSGYNGLNSDQNPYGKGAGGNTIWTTWRYRADSSSSIPSNIRPEKSGGEGGDGSSNNQAGTNGWAIVLY